MANSQYQKLVNSTQILRELQTGPKSRNYLVKTLNLQPSTVTYTLNRLKDINLVIDSKNVSSDNHKKGRKSTEVLINKESGVVFGVDLLVDSFKVVITYLDQSLFTEIEETFNEVIITAEKGTEKRFKQCINYVLSIVEAKCCNTKIFGGCISVAAIIGFDGTTLIRSLTHDILNVSILDCIENRNYPIYMENDANCAAIKYRENESDSYLYSLVRTYYNNILPDGVPVLGVGMGIVINGKIYRGFDSKAGEFINFVYQEGKQNRQLDIANEELMELNNNKASLKLFIDNYVNKLLFTNAFLNPRTIYLGGDSEVWNDNILKNIEDKFPEKTEEEIINTFCFTFLNHSENDIAYGASKLMIDFLFHMPYLHSKIQTWEQKDSPLIVGI
ncbi:MAG: hypothetical protein ACPKM0_01875 [Pleomorphochaeta sp.]